MGWFDGKKSHRTESYDSLSDNSSQRNTGPLMPNGKTHTWRIRGTDRHIRKTGLSYSMAQLQKRSGETIEPEQ